MLSGKLPFYGSAAELMDLHQHAVLPLAKLRGIPGPIIALLQVLLAKDPNQRFQTPAQLQKALTKVGEAVSSGSKLTADELKLAGDQVPVKSLRAKPGKQAVRWLLGAGLCFVIILIAGLFYSGHLGLFNQRVAQAAPTEKSIAVLPFDNISPNKDDAYFADGVQDEILNNLAKIAQLKVISRTSVMQYRADNKRDLRQIANALGVTNVLEGTVRRDATRVRVSTELVDAREDKTIWADSFDRNLTDIFAIQSEVAQAIAAKLAATLSPQEKQNIERKPTENLEAYDLYLRAKESLVNARIAALGDVRRPLMDTIALLDQAVRLDPKFTLAYCRLAEAHDLLYFLYDPTPEQRNLADAAISRALALQPDLPEVQLIYAEHLYYAFRDYERARDHLTIAKRGLPNDTEAIALEAFMDRRQGRWEKAIQEFKDALERDPGNSVSVENLALTLERTRQFRAAEQMFDRLIALRPDDAILKAQKPFTIYKETGDDTGVRAAIAAFPASVSDDRGVLSLRLYFAFVNRDWAQAKELIEKLDGGDDDGGFAYGQVNVPIGCYSILLARLQGLETDANASFGETRERLNERVQKAPENAPFLSKLAVLDALLNNKEIAIAEAKRAVELMPISKDAVFGPTVQSNLAVVYAWTNELDLAFETLSPLTKIPNGLFYGELKRDPYWDPLRKDPRFDKLLAELAPRD